MDDKLERDEHYTRLLELKEKVRQLNIVIKEGQFAEEFKRDHPFWPILNRTLLSLKESYNSDAHKAARDSRAEIANYLGREEAIKDIIYVIGEFSFKADSAESEKSSLEEEIKQLNIILSSNDTNSQDVGGVL